MFCPISLMILHFCSCFTLIRFLKKSYAATGIFVSHKKVLTPTIFKNRAYNLLQYSFASIFWKISYMYLSLKDEFIIPSNMSHSFVWLNLP